MTVENVVKFILYVILLGFSGCAVVVLSISVIHNLGQVNNEFQEYIKLSEVGEGQQPIVSNEDGTSTVLCVESLPSIDGVPEKKYDIVVKEVTYGRIVVDVTESLNYDKEVDPIVGFKTTKTIRLDAVVILNHYDLEQDRNYTRNLTR